MRRFLFASLLLALPASAIAGKGKQCDHPVDECLNYMVTKLKSTGFIGVELDDDKAHGGVLIVTNVVKGSPAEKAGIQTGDELYSMNGIRFGEETWKKMKEIKKPGNDVQVTIKRDGHAKKMRMVLAAMPADLMAKYIGEHMMTHAKHVKVADSGKRNAGD